MQSRALFGGALHVSLPDTWDDRSTHSFVAPEETPPGPMMPTVQKQRGFRPNVVIVREPRGARTEVEAFAREQLAAAQKQLPQLKVLEEGPRTVAGGNGYKRVLTFASPQGIAVQQVHVFWIVGDNLYTASFTTIPSAYEGQRTLFDEVISSFALEA